MMISLNDIYSHHLSIKRAPAGACMTEFLPFCEMIFGVSKLAYFTNAHREREAKT